MSFLDIYAEYDPDGSIIGLVPREKVGPTQEISTSEPPNVGGASGGPKYIGALPSVQGEHAFGSLFPLRQAAI